MLLPLLCGVGLSLSGAVRFRTVAPRLIARLAPQGEKLSFCYEAGPCGYGMYREITEMGHHCDVVAPGLVPRGATDRVKTDRRDALKLAR